MGCGKSKHDVASGNTVIQHKKSNLNSNEGQENVTKTKDINENIVDNISPGVELEHKDNESIKEFGVGGKADDGSDIEAKVKETNGPEDKEAEKPEGGKDDSLKEGNKKVNDVESKATETYVQEDKEAKKPEGGKDDSLKEEDKKVNDATIGSVEEKDPKENEKGAVENVKI